MKNTLFRMKMVEHGEKLTPLAEAMNISVGALSNKINKKSGFKQNEIAFLRDRWGLSAEDIDAIFFASPVS